MTTQMGGELVRKKEEEEEEEEEEEGSQRELVMQMLAAVRPVGTSVLLTAARISVLTRL